MPITPPKPTRLAPCLLAAALVCAPPGAGAVSAGPQQASAQAQVTVLASGLERSVKAAFLYKFLGYVEFPPSAFADPGAPVVIGVVGADDMAAELTRIVAGRTVAGRPVVVRSMRDSDSPAGVHLLFVGGGDAGRIARLARAAKDYPVVLVTEAEDGLRQGSTINFRIINERVRFDVSLDAADRSNVKLSSRLLTVAHQVHKGGS